MNVKELREALVVYPDDMEVRVFTLDHHTESINYVTDFEVSLDKIDGNEYVIIE